MAQCTAHVLFGSHHRGIPSYFSMYGLPSLHDGRNLSFIEKRMAIGYMYTNFLLARSALAGLDCIFLSPQELSSLQRREIRSYAHAIQPHLGTRQHPRTISRATKPHTASKRDEAGMITNSSS